jgi:PKD repeat protein
LTVVTVFPAVLYVDLNSLRPIPPYTNWETAATAIQDAINVAVSGDEVVVTNGVYLTGSAYHAANTIQSRVALTKPITLRSVNGPLLTSILGEGYLGSPTAKRCAYLTNGAALVGFTLTSGATDTYRDGSGAGVLCPSTSAVISNCFIIGNAANAGGGGVDGGTLYNCLIASNSVLNGGAAGVLNSLLSNCRIENNAGVGAQQSTLNNCLLSGNTRGGAYLCSLNACALVRNSALQGGGAAYSTLNHCTVVQNSAEWEGGGTYYCSLTNCIVYYNSANRNENWSGSSGSAAVHYTCTTPLPPDGIGNIADEPQLAGNWRLSAFSPCRGAGNPAHATDVDLDGEVWASPPSMGCDEVSSGPLAGDLSVAMMVSYTNVAVGFPVELEAFIDGRVSASRWGFGDGVMVSNRVKTAHAWASPGEYQVELRAYNESHPAGLATTVRVQVLPQQVHYVSQGSVSPAAPYRTWATAARDIQEAVNAAAQAGALVLVSNGVYQTGLHPVGGVTNRVAVTKPLILKSLNGPEETSIVGYRPSAINSTEGVRCVYLTNSSMLAGFTLTNGGTIAAGGGVWCNSSSAVVSNCVVAGNSADYQGGAAYYGTLIDCTISGNSAGYQGGGVAGAWLYNCALTNNTSSHSGGAAFDSVLNNCAVTGNSAAGTGGGASGGILNNCTVVGNVATDEGGGVYQAEVNNSIVYYNTSKLSGNNHLQSSLNHCCTFPLPSSGIGNIGSEPLLASNWRLSASSPCRGAGDAAYAGRSDIDRQPWANPPAIGCDEPWSGSITGLLSAAIVAHYTNVAVGVQVDLQGLVTGMASDSSWNFGDGTVVSNRPYLSYAWTTAGVYQVELRAYNESYPAGVSTSVVVQVWDEPVHYVRLDNPAPAAPFMSWATAATNIQDAVDASAIGGVVLVSNGVYSVGARSLFGMSNRVTVLKPVTVRSVNGPAVTSIAGYQQPGDTNGPLAIRCVYLGSEAKLQGFTLRNGGTQTAWDEVNQSGGGGVWCEAPSAIILDCVLAGNSAARYGGAVYGGTLTNCSLINNRSLFGGGAYGAGLSRCILSANSAEYGGAASSATLHDCTLAGNSALGYYGSGGGAYLSTLNRCTLSTNSSSLYGGGASRCVLYECTVVGNSVGGSSSGGGGGTADSVLASCTLVGNTSTQLGGGAFNGTLINCTLRGNSGGYGGGAASDNASPCILTNCTLMENAATVAGGGAGGCTLVNCALIRNSALQSGGGARYGSLNNCTVVGNRGGGVENATLSNSLVYYNTPINIASSTLDHCCAPLVSGSGNISAEPQLAGNWHLAASSPCRGAGNTGAAAGVDLNGDPWAQPPSIGCDEFVSGSATGALSVEIVTDYTNVATGWSVGFEALIEGPASSSRWDFGDGTVANNQPYLQHAWTRAGDYRVELRVNNETHPAGVATSIMVHVVADPVHYVVMDNPGAEPPYTSWVTAAPNIQDAVNTAFAGSVVLVSNGVYQTGATAVDFLSNRVAVTRPLTVRSVNGPQVTAILGYQVPGTTNGPSAVRCVYLTNGAVLAGFTLTNGGTAGSGGAVWCSAADAVVSNCVLVGNSAAVYGGGAHNGSLLNCVLDRNSALQGGGGASSALLTNCRLTANSAPHGGGAYKADLSNCVLAGNQAWLDFGGGTFDSSARNCTLVGNFAASAGGGTYAGLLLNCIIYYNGKEGSFGSSDYNFSSGSLSYCCTMPLPSAGIPIDRGNFTTAPRFINTNQWSDLRLLSNSPCINAGSAVIAGTDLDGAPRTVGSRVDVGAYEFQFPASAIAYAWLYQYGIPIDGTADSSDPDGDRYSNWQEWVAGTNPTNAASALRMIRVGHVGQDTVVVWNGVFGRRYFLERATSLGASGLFSVIATNLAGSVYTDTNATGPGPFLYRVGIRP